jgi:hypothetical protein
LLRFPDGADISVTGDSVATLADDGRRLVLRQGSAMATVPERPANELPVSLATAEAVLSHLSGVAMTLGRVLQRTEISVERGQVEVSATTGESCGAVRAGEILTVYAGGVYHKQRMLPTPDNFRWDLTGSRPTGWHVGQTELTPQGTIVRPQRWFDPYHQAEMYQIRSHSQWAPAFFRLYPDSTVRVRYWVDRPGPSQVVVCVRTDRPPNPATGCVEYNGAFAQARPNEWQWLEIKAKDMLDNVHAPKFAAPWVGFLVIFNTYEQDLGLRIAGIEVVRPSEVIHSA